MAYEQIKEMAKNEECSYRDLIILAPQNDPFYCGTPTDIAKAEWFAGFWNRFNYKNGAHLRRVHYQIISQEDKVKKHDGTEYKNTLDDWSYLCIAGKYARYLGLVDPEAFTDRRNPNPVVIARYDDAPTPGFEIGEPYWSIPEMSSSADMDPPDIDVKGYDEHPIDERFHLEIWIEKSTMEEILMPICKRYKANYISGIGYLSITGIIAMLRRATESGKPVRIFYISDFDPSGSNMPVAVARQIQFWINTYASGADIKLQGLVLTHSQVDKYDKLPRVPIKDTDLSKKKFEDEHGEGAIELDALEALYPGELGKIVECAISDFRDPEIIDDLYWVKDDAEEMVASALSECMEPFEDRILDLSDRISEVVEKYKGFEEEAKPLREEMAALQAEVEAALRAIEIDLPDRPRSEIEEPEVDWLYDSSRDYREQVDIFKDRGE